MMVKHHRDDSQLPADSARLDKQESPSDAKTAGLWGQRLPTSPKNEPRSKKEAAWWNADRILSGAYDVAWASQLELDFRHSGWHAQRMQTLEALHRTGQTTARKDRFAHCGARCTVQRKQATDTIRLLSSNCHDRFCRICGTERSRAIARNLLAGTTDKELRFITLTLKHNSQSLAHQIDRLYTCFNRLRERAFWKSKVKGSACFLEIKRSKNGRFWHPHLHLISEGSYLPKSTLVSEWLAVTGDSYIVDVQYVDDRERCAAYVTKYASKPLDSTVYLQPEYLDEAILALKGRKLCGTTGSFRAIKLEEKATDEGPWITIGTLAEIRNRATEGSLADRAICTRIGLNWPATATDQGPEPPS